MNTPKSRPSSSPGIDGSAEEQIRNSSPNVAMGGAGEGRDLAALLRDAMTEPSPTVDVLPGIQQKLRERSGGKFYADSWSTDRFPPIPTYLVTSTLMLVIVLATYLVLRPLSGEPAKSPPPAPILVLPSQTTAK